MLQIQPGKFVKAEEFETEKIMRRARKGGRHRLAEEVSAALVR